MLSCKIITAQDEWVRFYGEGQHAIGNSITIDYDNGAVIGGMINDYRYLWVNKIDVNGNVLWEKKIGTYYTDCGLGNIEKTADGGYILCGSWNLVNTVKDAFIMKLNPCAEIEWCKVLNTPDNYDMGFRVKPTPEGDYVLMGGYFVTEPESNTSLFKFDASGNLKWHQFYPLDSIYYQDQPNDLLIDDDGYLILTERYYPDPGTTSPAILRHHFTKTDTSGAVLWDLTYGVNEYYYGDPVVLQKSSTGAYYEAGMHFYAHNYTARPGFVKIAKDGTPLYHADVLSDVYWGGLSSIDIFQDSLLIAVGGYYPIENLHLNAFFKTDTLGNLLEMRNIQVATNGYQSTVETNDSKFIAIGVDLHNSSWRVVAVKVNSDLEYDTLYTQPRVYDSLCSYPIVNETINPTCDNVIVKVDEPFIKPETTRLNVYPNPSDKYVLIELPKYLIVNTNANSAATTIYHQWSAATLQLIDIHGKLLMQQKVSNSDELVRFDISDLKSGIYQIRLLFKGKTVAGSKMMVK